MIGKKVTLEELEEHLKGVHPRRKIDRIIIHHFWRPTAAQYRGLATIQSVHDYHVSKGWSDIGYHIVIAPNDDIWLGRPIEQAGAHTVGQNQRSIGLTYAADFDTEDPLANGYHVGVQVTVSVCRRFGLDEDDVYFHRDFANKTCPGRKMDRARFRHDVSRVLEGEPEGNFVRLKIDDKLILGAKIRIVNNKAMGLEGPIADALGIEVREEERNRLIHVREYLERHGVIIPPGGWRREHGPSGTIYAYTVNDAPEEEHPGG